MPQPERVDLFTDKAGNEFADRLLERGAQPGVTSRDLAPDPDRPCRRRIRLGIGLEGRLVITCTGSGAGAGTRRWATVGCRSAAGSGSVTSTRSASAPARSMMRARNSLVSLAIAVTSSRLRRPPPGRRRA